MSFYQHKEIKDVIAYFRLVANPNDEEALKRVINYPKRGIGDTTISKLIAASRACNVSLWDVVGNPSMYNAGVSAGTEKKVLGFYYLIDEFIRDNRTVDAYGLGKEILEKSGLKFELAADKSIEGVERQENIEEFMSGLHDFVDTKREEGYEDEVYIANFLQEVALLTDSDEENDDDNDASSNERVSLMTIHASKGLEFNSVFVVGLEENIFPSPRSCSSVRELEEERRLLYVAITRAQEHCLMTYATSRYINGQTHPCMPSRFLKDIDSALLELPRNPNTWAAPSQNDFEPRVRTRIVPRQQKPEGFVPVRKAVAEAAPSSSGGDTDGLRVGARINHLRFGDGTVTKIEKEPDVKITVDFDNTGIKVLLLKFAKFKIIG